MAILYHIRPKDDGYHVLGRSMTGKHYLINKDYLGLRWQGEFVFGNEIEAQEYINKYNLEGYKPEQFWRSDDTLTRDYKPILSKLNILLTLPCPDCGHTLRSMVTVGADESDSGFSESLYHCENDDCGSDFNLCRDANGKFIKMERYFFG